MTTEAMTQADNGHTVPQDEIKDALALLFQYGDVVELRALVAGRKEVTSGYYNDFDKLAKDATQLDARGRMSGIYVTLNKPKPALLARRANRYDVGGETTHDHEIARRTHLFFDVDAERPSGISSTDEEHEYAIQKGEAIRTWLRELGLPGSVLFDSGNGAGIVYDIDLPNDPESTELVKRVLEAVDMVKSDGKAHIDTSVYNAARIFKLPGTMARKGDSTQDMPHRRSRIITVDPDRAVVPLERLQYIARLPDLMALNVPTNTTTGKGFDIREFIARHKIGVREEKPFKYGTMFVLDECPFCGHEESRITQNSNGAVGFGCFHNSCQGYKWAELREKFEPGYKERKAEQLLKPDTAFPPSSNSDAADRALARGEAALRKSKDEQIREAQQRETKIEADAKQPATTAIDEDVLKWTLSTIADAYKPRPPIEYAVGKMIEVPSLNMIVAPPGHHKTNIAISMAVHIACGRSWLPSGTPTFQGRPVHQEVELFTVSKARPVLFVDQDNGERRTADRIAEIARGIDAPADAPLFYVSMPIPPFMASSPTSIDVLRKSIVESKAEVLFIDTFGSTIGNSDENTAEMLPIMKNLRCIAEEMKVGVVLLHHSNKRQSDGGRDGDRIRGFSGIEGGLDNVFLVERNLDKDSEVEIRNIKFRGERTPDITASYWREDGQVSKAGFWGICVGNRSDLTYQSQCLVIYDILSRTLGGLNQKEIIARALGMVKKKNGKDAGREFVVSLLSRMVTENKLTLQQGPERRGLVYQKA